MPDGANCHLRVANRNATLLCLLWFFVCSYAMVTLQLSVEYQERSVMQEHRVQKQLYDQMIAEHERASSGDRQPPQEELTERDESDGASDAYLDPELYLGEAPEKSQAGEGDRQDYVEPGVLFESDRVLSDVLFSVFTVHFDRGQDRWHERMLDALVNWALLYCLLRCAFVSNTQLIRFEHHADDGDGERRRVPMPIACYRYISKQTPMQHALLAMGFVYLLRGVVLFSTHLPNPFQECQSTIDPADGWIANSLHVLLKTKVTCADVMFSGHAASLALFSMMALRYFSRIEAALMCVYSAVTCALLAIFHFHYTCDVIVGCVVSVLCFSMIDYACSFASTQRELALRENALCRPEPPTKQRAEPLDARDEEDWLGAGAPAGFELTRVRESSWSGSSRALVFRPHRYIHRLVPCNSIPFCYVYHEDEIQHIVDFSRRQRCSFGSCCKDPRSTIRAWLGSVCPEYVYGDYFSSTISHISSVQSVGEIEPFVNQ